MANFKRKPAAQAEEDKDTKFKKPYQKVRRNTSRRKFSKADDRVKESRNNDPAWYKPNDQLYKDTTNIPWTYPTGLTYVLQPGSSFTDSGGDTHTFATDEFRVPGILTAYVVGYPGVATSANDAVNVAKNAMYASIRRANSGSTNYDPPDLFTYMLCVASMFSYISMLTRLYGIVNTASGLNRYIPEGLFQAHDVDVVNIRANLANFRAGINQLVMKASTLYVPNTMSYFLRQFWLYSNVFIDNPSAKSQLYWYVPAGFWKYDEMSYSTGSVAEYTPFLTDPLYSPNNYTYDQLLQYGWDLLNPMLYSEDIGVISGDILKRFEEGGLWHLSTVPDDYTVLPVESVEALEQFKNASIIGSVRDMGLWDWDSTAQDFVPAIIYHNPNTNILRCHPIVRRDFKVGQTILGTHESDVDQWVGVNVFNASDVITTFDPAPTSDVSMVNSRLMINNVTVANETDANNVVHTTLKPNQTGTELVVGCSITWRVGSAGTWYSLDPNWTIFINSLNGVAGITQTDLRLLGWLSNFRYHPTLKLITYDGGTKNVQVSRIHDYDNFAIVAPNTLGKLHDTALLGEFNVPAIGLAN